MLCEFDGVLWGLIEVERKKYCFLFGDSVNRFQGKEFILKVKHSSSLLI